MFQAAHQGLKLLLAGLLAGACTGAAVAQSPLDLSSGDTAWISEGTEWVAVPGGPQPVTFDPKFPYVPNNTGKQPTFRVADRGIPDLGRPAAVDELRLARDRPLLGGAEEVRLQLDRRESGSAFGQGEHAAVSARGVRQRDDGAGVEVTVRRHQRLPQREVRTHELRLERVELDPDQSREVCVVARVECHGAEPTLAAWPRS